MLARAEGDCFEKSNEKAVLTTLVHCKISPPKRADPLFTFDNFIERGESLYKVNSDNRKRF